MSALCLLFFFFFATNVAAQTNDYPSRLGSVHWAGCYFLTDEPYLIEGAKAIAEMGSKVIKIALFNPSGNYLWNNHWPSNMTNNPTTRTIVQDSYYRQLFEMPEFETYIMVAFSTLGADYWRQGMNANQYNTEMHQMYETSLYLLQTYVGPKSKTFVFQNWEGDWAIRGDYNTNTKPTQTEINGMQMWYSARQAGVNKARNEYWSNTVNAQRKNEYWKSQSHLQSQPSPNVYLAAEVNLVVQAMQTGFPDTILSVLPFVSIDIISYSAYDSFCSSNFQQALAFIDQHHNKTKDSPPNSVYIGEFGLPQMKDPLSKVETCTKQSIEVAYNYGCPYLMWWEVYDNECTSCPDSHCSASTGPITNVNDLNGFWLLMPNGTKAWSYTYFQSLYIKNLNVNVSV